MGSEATLAILTNPHALEVSQDPLGQQAVLLASGRLPSSATHAKPDWQVFGRPLASPPGSFAVALLNRNRSNSIKITANFAALSTSSSFRVLDLWDGARDLGVHGSFAADVANSSAKMYKLVPVASSLNFPVV